MLASETQSIAEVLKKAMINKFGLENIKDHFGDTKDTLCYATNENQNATKTLIENGGNLAIVVGGYNSSNTSHLVELCESKISTFFIKDCEEVISETEINHFSLNLNKVVLTKNWLPKVKNDITEIIITSGASCPDALVDEVILKIVSFYPNSKSIDEALIPFMQ
ncbi:MAG: 4-hydroxy-3-methylbut-2-enyl diphosphate reductase, partial [Candidatus Kapaibacterium sp.]